MRDGYTIQREYEDVAEVVDTLAEQWDGAVDVLGHSYGGLCALAAAQMTPNVRRLALYESPVLATERVLPARSSGNASPHSWPRGGARRCSRCSSASAGFACRRSARGRFRLLPAWSARLAVAHTLVREQQAIAGFQFDAAVSDDDERAHAAPRRQRTARSSSGPRPRRSPTPCPNPRVEVLEGQQHAAMDTAPQLFAETRCRKLLLAVTFQLSV